MQNFGLYIHIPFCQRKCKYCDFTSFDKCDENTKTKYIDCLIHEIMCRGTGHRALSQNAQFPMSNQMPIITTIYIGGRNTINIITRRY